MKAEDDPFDLQRFVAAQDAGGTYRHATAELRAGRKVSHWMWFVFPQIAGLGYSPVSRAYAITSLAEARAYLAHPVLGARLIECAVILTGVPGRTAEQIFGEVDALKLRSSMTLFLHAAPDQPVFRRVLGQYFDGIPDPATEQRILSRQQRACRRDTSGDDHHLRWMLGNFGSGPPSHVPSAAGCP